MSRWQGIKLFTLFTLVQTARSSSALPASPTQYTTQSSTTMRTTHMTVKVELHGAAAMPSFGSLPVDQVAKVVPFWNSTELSGEVDPGGTDSTSDQASGASGISQVNGVVPADSGDCTAGGQRGSQANVVASTKTHTKTEVIETTTTTTTTIMVPAQFASASTTTTTLNLPASNPPIRTPSPYTQTFKKTKTNTKSSQLIKSPQTVTSWTQVFQSTSQTQVAKPKTSANSSTSTTGTTTTATKSSATQQATGTGKLTQWNQGVLDQHNSFRAKYKADPLKWDATLASTAMQWAQKCEWKHDPALGSLKQGQNMDSAAASNGKAGLTPEAVLEHWVTAEVAAYDPNNPQASHFTQVVWKGTSSVGCASVSCNLSMYDPSWWPASFVVCNYGPPGNVAGQYAANVAM